MGGKALERCIQGDALPQHFTFNTAVNALLLLAPYEEGQVVSWQWESWILQTKVRLLKLTLLLQRQKWVWKLGGRQIARKSNSILVGLGSPATHSRQWGRKLWWGEIQSWSNSELLHEGIPSFPEKTQRKLFSLCHREDLYISFSEILLNEPKVILISLHEGGQATFSICTERHFQAVAWGQKAPSVLGMQAGLLPSQFSLSSMNMPFP